MKHTLEMQLETPSNYAIRVIPLYNVLAENAVVFSIQFLDSTYCHWIGRHQDFQTLLDKYGFIAVDHARLNFEVPIFNWNDKLFAHPDRVTAWLSAQPEYRQRTFNGVVVNK